MFAFLALFRDDKALKGGHSYPADSLAPARYFSHRGRSRLKRGKENRLFLLIAEPTYIRAVEPEFTARFLASVTPQLFAAVTEPPPTAAAATAQLRFSFRLGVDTNEPSPRVVLRGKTERNLASGRCRRIKYRQDGDHAWPEEARGRWRRERTHT